MHRFLHTIIGREKNFQRRIFPFSENEKFIPLFFFVSETFKEKPLEDNLKDQRENQFLACDKKSLNVVYTLHESIL